MNFGNPSSKLSMSVSLLLLVIVWSIGSTVNQSARNVIFLLEQVLRIRVPHLIVPFSLDRSSLLLLDFIAAMLDRLSAKVLSNLVKVVHDLFLIHVLERLVLHIPVNVSCREVRMSVSAHSNFQVQVLMLVHKVD